MQECATPVRGLVDAGADAAKELRERLSVACFPGVSEALSGQGA